MPNVGFNCSCLLVVELRLIFQRMFQKKEDIIGHLMVMEIKRVAWGLFLDYERMVVKEGAPRLDSVSAGLTYDF